MAAPVIDKIVAAYKHDEGAQLIDLMYQGWAELEKHGLGGWATIHASNSPVTAATECWRSATCPSKLARSLKSRSA